MFYTNKPIFINCFAAIVSIEDLKNLEEMEDKLDIETAQHVDKEIQKHGTAKWNDAKKELDLC